MRELCTNEKTQQIRRRLQRHKFRFRTMIFETTGGVNSEGLEMLRQLFRFAAKHQNLQLSVYCGRAWARLSCSLQFSVSQCLLNRAGSVAAIENHQLAVKAISA